MDQPENDFICCAMLPRQGNSDRQTQRLTPDFIVPLSYAYLKKELLKHTHTSRMAFGITVWYARRSHGDTCPSCVRF